MTLSLHPRLAPSRGGGWLMRAGAFLVGFSLMAGGYAWWRLRTSPWLSVDGWEAHQRLLVVAIVAGAAALWLLLTGLGLRQRSGR